MAGSEALGIRRLEAILFEVADLQRSHTFYTERMDFAWTGETSEAVARERGEKASVYEAGTARVICRQPLTSTSPSGRYLQRHPDGISTLLFEVDDVDRTFRTLDERGGTPVQDVQWENAPSGGRFGWFEITTAFGEVRFRFVQRDGARDPLPWLPAFDEPGGGGNAMGFTDFDHVTSNFLTLKPMELWCKEVLGLEEYWEVAFHTDDVAPDSDHGSGLKSLVLWDPHSGVKFANNEPFRPYFEASQIHHFVVDNRGAGVQHLALATEDIQSTVRGIQARGGGLRSTPGTYYDQLPKRLEENGIELDEDIDALRELEILVDGKPGGRYLLQIFMQDAWGLYDDPQAGPFFFEIIQRKGNKGFGEGNFRALFESIEAEQKQTREA